jgi:hypothetical protein
VKIEAHNDNYPYAGLYGDLQGIAGKSLEEIEGLESNLLPAAEGA